MILVAGPLYSFIGSDDGHVVGHMDQNREFVEFYLDQN